MKKIETVIVGGGQAGLATSYHLKQLKREHIVFEQAEKAGNVWRNARWDSFTLVFPNWTMRLPGAHYDGDDPDGFLTKPEIVAYFEKYVEQFNLPVQYNIEVLEITLLEDGNGYQVKTSDGTFQAENVVMATGSFQKPRIPAFSASMPADILQIHSADYRNPKQLPEGAVLVVGSGQSGMQIAEELYQSGRKVYLSVGSTPRVPRRYRGRDIISWFVETGFFGQTVNTLPSPKARLASNPHLSGKDGGHSLNLHQFARDGVRLLGYLAGAQDGKVLLKPNLKENLAKADQVEKDIVGMIDRYIEKNGIDAPPDTLPDLEDGYSVEVITELDLESANINSVIWAIGYTADYSLVKLAITDEDGFPIQQRGVTQYPGLYFVGMTWLHKRDSATLPGVGEDVEYIVAHMTK
ncbi:MAG: NAD(P)-binding domain-containing protein [Candidatus Promineifilaceae bacterium]|nr:NAD(P)-binding domain-containing protein [Candidatus Promineifilaceae bacterium]